MANASILARVESGPVAFFAPDFVRAVYTVAGDTPLWTERQLVHLRALIESAPEHGLVPQDYLIGRLPAEGTLQSLRGEPRFDADLIATEAFLRFGYHLQFGKVDPLALDAAWNYGREVEVEDPPKLVVELIRSPDLTAAIKPLVRHGPLYARLRGWLKTYREIEARGGWTQVSAGPTLHPGDRDARVAELRTRLGAEGFASSAEAPELFDASLLAATQGWQERHGLETDGLIGPKSLGVLNLSVSELVDRLRVNLERLRWAAPERHERALLVNIAGFTLQLRGGGNIRWTTRVMVGKPWRQTPVFRSSMTYLVLNPDWTVPPTILRLDKLPAIRKDPGYLAKQHMDVVTTTGRPVNPESIDWASFDKQRFPYFLRQRPGPWNALGQVKFIFPNDHFVFLHDTPGRELFAQSERSFSSGCIRVDQPLDLAALLLEDQAGYSRGEIDTIVASGETRTVFLKEPLPVLLQYLTAAELESGQFRFHRDIYKRDARVLTALNAPPPEHEQTEDQ